MIYQLSLLRPAAEETFRMVAIVVLHLHLHLHLHLCNYSQIETRPS
jgi:hypothetical protein